MNLSNRATKDEDGSITIDVGDGELIKAKRFEIDNSCSDERVKQYFGQPFTFVVVTWDNGNYGYFADAGFFWKSMHRDWQLVPVAAWMNEYDVEMEDTEKSPIMNVLKKIAEKDVKETLPTGLNLFLQDYPEFKELFE